MKKIKIDQGGKYLFKTTANGGVRVHLQNLSLSRIEETDPAVTYFGEWNTFPISSNSGSSAKYSDVSGAFVSVKFSGSSISIIGYKSSYYGIGDVYIDENKVGSIDYYSANTAFQQTLFEKSGLVDGLHTLKIVQTGQKNTSAIGTNINIDYFSIDYDLNSGLTNASDVSYHGSWETFINPANRGGTARYSNDPTAYMSMKFTGSSISVIGYKAQYYGIANVFIDDDVNPVGHIDYYSPSTQFQQTLFQASNLSKGQHTLKIVPNGKNPLATSANINIDSVEVGNGLGKFEETDSHIAYSGSWQTFSSNDNSGGSAKYSDTTDASATFTFTGASVKFGGYKAVYYGMADVFIDTKWVASIDYYSPNTQFQQTLFQISGLTDTTHTLEVKRAGIKNDKAIGSNINIDFVETGNGAGLFEETTPNASYIGKWNNFASSLNSGGSAKYSNDPGATFTSNFTGAYVKVIGYKSVYYGKAEVFIDENSQGLIDYYSPSTQYQQLLFRSLI